MNRKKLLKSAKKKEKKRSSHEKTGLAFRFSSFPEISFYQTNKLNIIEDKNGNCSDIKAVPGKIEDENNVK